MVRRKSGQRTTAEETSRRRVWWETADSHPSMIADWDLKSEQFTQAVLEVLASGDAIMFGVTQSGDAVSVTIYSGEDKSRKWVADSIELDDLMGVICKRGKAERNASNIRHIADTGN